MKFSVSTFKGYNEPGNGRHATELVMAVVGEHGAIVWRMTTGVTPYSPVTGYNSGYELLYDVCLDRPGCVGLSAHSEMTMENTSEPDNVITENCEYLSGRACVCTMFTGMKGKELFKAFACEGFQGVEAILTREYKEHYNADI